MASSKKQNGKRGRQFSYNHALANRYAKRLMALSNRMTASVRKELITLFSSSKDNFAAIKGISSQSRIILNKLNREWQKEFNDLAKNMTPKMMTSILKESKAATLNNLKALYDDVTLNNIANSTELSNVFKASTSQAVNYIRTIPQEYFSDIQGEVMRSITNNGSLASLTAEIRKYDTHTRHRAVNIALDQTRKAYQGFNLTMCRKAGITQGIWIHSKKLTHARRKHLDFDRKQFDLAVGAPVGTMRNGPKYVQPAEEPFCDCTWLPVIEF